MSDVRPYWVSGRARTGEESREVRSPWDGALAGVHAVPTDADVETAVATADAVSGEAAALPIHVRAAALDHVSHALLERHEEAARLVTAESGKPLRWSRVEVTRASAVFRWAAEESRRWSGVVQRLDTEASSSGRLGYTTRVPRGPVLAVAPFNFPLNLVAHKVAPAIAVGAPVVVKPAPATPLSALLLGEILAGTSLPEGMLSVLPVDNAGSARLVRDPRLPVVSFTGSGPVGWSIREAVPRKHVTLELGGDAAAVVCPDWASDADLDHAAERIAVFSSYQAGQSCVSVQRVVVAEALHERLLDRLVPAMTDLATGSPWDDGTVVGPLIDEAAAHRVEDWVDEAVAAGATLHCGGVRAGATYAPTLLSGVPTGVRLATEEVFGPVLVVERVAGVDEAFARVNASRFGLQAGVFTHDLRTAFRAHRELEVGGVVIGDVPSFRADQMPYGGAKESGVGREGVLSAMHDLTYERVMVLSGLSL